jgi:hypothetical protein
MVRNLFAKPILVVIGSAALGVFTLATFFAVAVSVQRTNAPAHPLTPNAIEQPGAIQQGAIQQFDESTQNAAADSRQDSPEGAYGSMPQSGNEVAAGAAPNSVSIGGTKSDAAQGPQYAPASYASSPSSGTRWTQLVSPDGSATVALPDNWRIVGGAKGSVAIEGPGSEQIVLGMQTFVTSNQAPYMAPEQALAWFMRSHGTPLLGIQDRQAQHAASGQAELMIVESEMQGRKYKGVARVTTSQIGMGNWMLQVTSIGAPAEQFDADFPTMQKIWNSWNLDPNYVRNAFQTAANMRQQTATMVANGAMTRFNGWKPFNESWDQTMRGVSTMENSSLGKRVETPLGSEQQYLNNCTRNGQDCRQVPMNELVQPQ